MKLHTRILDKKVKRMNKESALVEVFNSSLKSVFIILFVFFSFIAKSQEALPQLDLNMALAIPINDPVYVDSSSSTTLTAFGFGGGFTIPVFEKSPVRLGASFRYMWIGSESRDFSFIDDQGYEYELTTTVKGSMSPLHLMFRIDPVVYTNFPVLPYAGAFAGIRFFGSNNKLTFDYQDGTEPIVENNREISVTSSYGFELGLHVRLGKDILLDFRYEHAYGGWAEYIDFSTVEIDNNGNASYDLHETRTDVAMFTLGVAIVLKDGKTE